jgi:SNF2 family DNA or RNA helicase
MKLYPFQEKVLQETRDQNKVAYYLDMGLGKTFVGSEKMVELGERINLVVCQKSKIDDWYEHFKQNYSKMFVKMYDLTKPKEYKLFIDLADSYMKDYVSWQSIGIINYDLVFRRPELLKLSGFTLLLDESSCIQNETAKRSKFVLKMQPKNVILLSGTPTSGKYENLWSQLHLLGWPISKQLYWRQYIDTEVIDNEGFPITVVRGYKNVDRLKTKLRQHGAVFMKSEEVFDLPEQVFNKVRIELTKEYKRFRKSRIVEIGEREFVGDTLLTKMLYERMLCGSYNAGKLKALNDLIESTEDRLIVFYNFNEELREIENVCLELNRPLSMVNGQTKDLSVYEEYENSVTAIQYQAGAMGLNLQKANKIIYFTPPLSSELFEQSKKRTHRIGQKQTCFYYELICKNSIEEKIYKALSMRRDYTDELFKEEGNND